MSNQTTYRWRVADDGQLVATIRKRWPLAHERKGRADLRGVKAGFLVAIYAASKVKQKRSFVLVHNVDIYATQAEAEQCVAEIGLPLVHDVKRGITYITREEACLMALRDTFNP